MYNLSNDRLRNEIIITLMNKLHKDDIKNHDENLANLKSLSLNQLDELLGNYYLNLNKEENNEN